MRGNIQGGRISLESLENPAGLIAVDSSTFIVMFDPQHPFRQVLENLSHNEEHGAPPAIICAPWDVRYPLNTPGDESSYRTLEYLEYYIKPPFTGPGFDPLGGNPLCAFHPIQPHNYPLF